MDTFQMLDVIETMENYLEIVRPPESMRPKLDIGYTLEKQSVIIHEIRPRLSNPKIAEEFPVAKASYVKRQDNWKIYWMPGSENWMIYEPTPTVKKLKGFLKIVEEDKHGSFWG